MRPLSEATAKLSGRFFKRKYLALGRIVSHWNDIVGQDMADKAQPVKIYYQKRKNQKTPPKARLDIATTPSHATALHYQKDLILERIAQIFGERWIDSIRFVTQATNIDGPKMPVTKERVLSARDKADLARALEAIGDQDLKNRLEKLGEAVISESQNKEEH